MVKKLQNRANVICERPLAQKTNEIFDKILPQLLRAEFCLYYFVRFFLEWSFKKNAFEIYCPLPMSDFCWDTYLAQNRTSFMPNYDPKTYQKINSDILSTTMMNSKSFLLIIGSRLSLHNCHLTKINLNFCPFYVLD